MSQIHVATDEAIEAAADRIRSGSVVAFPTETVYGLGAAAFQPQAVARVFEMKSRPHFDPLIVHLSRREELAEVACGIPATAWQLVDAFWPGPLTLILSKSDRVPSIVTSGAPTVAVRMPAHRVARRLIERVGMPLAAPSANRFGRVSPTCAEHVREGFADEDLMILDGGPCAVGVESTVLSLVDPTPRVLRPGGIDLESLRELLGTLTFEPSSARQPHAPTSPGMLAAHYAPLTPLSIASSDDLPPLDRRKTMGLLCLRVPDDAVGFASVEQLSAEGNLREAATRLFAAMRRLDAAGVTQILALPVPETGLGVAIMDRLRRAAASHSVAH